MGNVPASAKESGTNSEGLITWRFSARDELSAWLTGLKFTHDYMRNVNPGCNLALKNYARNSRKNGRQHKCSFSGIFNIFTVWTISHTNFTTSRNYDHIHSIGDENKFDFKRLKKEIC